MSAKGFYLYHFVIYLGDMMKLTAKMKEHLRKHQTYPATRAQLIKACNNLADFTSVQKKWFAKALPARTYKSASDVVKALS